MLRLLIEIATTLERVPDERYILMKLEYTDDTPDSFTTPNFCPADPQNLVAHFEQAPFTMCDAFRHCLLELRCSSLVLNVTHTRGDECS
jgi:HORMA domain